MLGCEMNGSTCDIPPPQTRPPACAEFQGSIQLKWKITGIHQTDATRQPKGLGWDVDCVLKCGKQQEFCYNKVHNKTWILLNLCRLCQALCEYKKDPTNAATYCNKKTTTVSKKNLPTHVQQKNSLPRKFQLCQLPSPTSKPFFGHLGFQRIKQLIQQAGILHCQVRAFRLPSGGFIIQPPGGRLRPKGFMAFWKPRKSWSTQRCLTWTRFFFWKGRGKGTSSLQFF